MPEQNFIDMINTFVVTNLAKILMIAFIIILLLVGLRLIRLSRHRIEARIIDQRVDENQRPRLRTLLRAGISAVQVFIIAITTLIILETLGVNITPVLASAGVAGLAVSLGAQTLIKDYIGGIIVLFENQFNVGDVIEVGSFIGTVERIELRSTYVRDIQGRLINIPNGDIRIYSNNTRGWNRALVDLNIAFNADVNQVMEALRNAIRLSSADEELGPLLLEEPQIQGWNNLSEWAIQVRLSAKTLPGKQFIVATILRKYALRALQDADISLALPPGTNRPPA
jgi:small conductance mechanosensitive channel